MKEPLEILSAYRNRVERLKAIGSQHREIQPLTIPDVLYIKAVLHPTAKKSSLMLTRRLIKHLCDAGICTATDIYTALDCADKPILQRLRKFRDMGLVRREAKRYYIPTDRMMELKAKYLDKVCGT